MSDNGASQEGGPRGMVNYSRYFNGRPETIEESMAIIDQIGTPYGFNNYPWGWAQVGNTPGKRYKQNTHGGGIRDPLVVSWPNGLAARGEVRPHFAHACDVAPTLLDLLGVAPPDEVGGVKQAPLEGESFAAALRDPAAPPRRKAQYFEMFGHRGLWKDGWKAVAFHPPGAPFDNDRWELFHLDRDFSETDDLAEREPERLKALVDDWWAAAEAHKVLPLDDRFGPRFAENSARFHGARRRFVFHKGMGHLPTDVAPDVRARTYRIDADVRLSGGEEGVLLAHGDATSGYSLYLRDGRLHHTLNIGGQKTTVTSDRPVPPTATRLGVVARRSDEGPRTFTLTVDGQAAGAVTVTTGFATLISWSGLDIGLDRGSPVADYAAPFAFTGVLHKVTVSMEDDQALDGDAVGEAEMARQ
jgi:arylsulfatase